MTYSNDDFGVMRDDEVMRAAAELLAPLTPDRAPSANAELTAMMAVGVTPARTMRSRVSGVVTRFAGLGAAAKLMLAAGVAVAGAGGAATVAYETGHLDNHRTHHSPNHPEPVDDNGHNANQHPAGTTSSAPRPIPATAPESGDDHPGQHRGRGIGSDDNRGSRRDDRHGGHRGPEDGRGHRGEDHPGHDGRGGPGDGRGHDGGQHGDDGTSGSGGHGGPDGSGGHGGPDGSGGHGGPDGSGGHGGSGDGRGGGPGQPGGGGDDGGSGGRGSDGGHHGGDGSSGGGDDGGHH